MDKHRLEGAALFLVILTAVALPACAQTRPSTTEEATRAYLSTLPAGDGEGNFGGQASTETGVAYEFVCRSQLYRLALRQTHPGGSLSADHVRLEDIDQPGSGVSGEDRRRIQMELDQFRVVHMVSLRCAGNGVHAFLVDGFSRPVDGDGVQPSRTRLLWFENGRLTRIAE